MINRILRPYQRDCIDQLTNLQHALVYMPVGAGKTAITLFSMIEKRRRRDIDKWLIVAPPRVAEHVWAQEAAKWPQLASMRITRYLGPPLVRQTNATINYNVLVTHFGFLDEVMRIVKADTGSKWGLVIDELACVTSRDTKRFKILTTDAEDEYGYYIFKATWGLTATPVSNKLEDIFTQARVVEGGLRLTRFKHTFMTEFFYPIQFGFKGKVTKWAPKPGAYAAICERLQDVMITIPDSEYKAQLPDVVHIDVNVTMPEKTRAEYNSTANGYRNLNPQDGREITNALDKLEQLTAGFIYLSGHTAKVLDEAKIEAIKELVDSLNGAPYVLVYRFIQSQVQLLEQIPGLEDFKSDGAFDRFKEGKTQGLLIHPESAGHGIDGMQYVCNNMIWIQPPWSARQWEQTVGRLARSGQEKTVFVHTIMMEESVDQVIKKALTTKLDVARIFLEHIKEITSI